MNGNSVMNEKIETALLVVKSQVYDKVILIFEMGNHILVKMDQQSFAGFLQYLFDHVCRYIVLLGNLS